MVDQFAEPVRKSTPSPDYDSANYILCHREQGYVGAQRTFHYDRNHIVPEADPS